jgi:geranylgeranyl diphosphate synthase type I
VEDVLALKTASYTVTGPLLLGWALSSGDPGLAQALERFGRPLGIAFQLRDDLLGVFGDPSETGKPVGNDIRRGKETALVAELRLASNGSGAALLERVLGNDAASDGEVADVVAAMVDSGAKARVEARVTELCGTARAMLASIRGSRTGLEGPAAAWLGGAIDALGERSS